MAYKTFLNGYNLSAPEINTYLMNQVVIVFASSGDRSTAIPTPTAGMTTFLTDSNTLQTYNGTAWVNVGAGAETFLSPLLLMGA